MGAVLWFHEAPWHSDPEDALRALQAQFLATSYDLPALVREHLARGEDLIMKIDVQGAAWVRKRVTDDGVFIFLDAPSADELRRRLVERSEAHRPGKRIEFERFGRRSFVPLRFERDHSECRAGLARE